MMRVHILQADDWTAGVITLLAPASPYRPWCHPAGGARLPEAFHIHTVDPLPRVGPHRPLRNSAWVDCRDLVQESGFRS